ncbi:MAG: hypothetical protein FWE33_05585 [Defluviitaleaceae bacterium]|nr:hypothetical protein [Defluviitaleaceae bacterium]
MQFLRNFLDKGDKSNGDEKGGKKSKKVQNLLIMLLVGVLLLLASSYFANRSSGGDEDFSILPLDDGRPQLSSAVEQASEAVARQMEEILSQIAGAGEVRVMLTFGTSINIYAQNTQASLSHTTEEDGEGGLRSIDVESSTHTYVMVRQPDGSERPLRIQEIHPQVEGVIVVAQGAGDVVVRDALVRATHTLLGIGAHRVQVFQMTSQSNQN